MLRIANKVRPTSKTHDDPKSLFPQPLPIHGGTVHHVYTSGTGLRFRCARLRHGSLRKLLPCPHQSTDTGPPEMDEPFPIASENPGLQRVPSISGLIGRPLEERAVAGLRQSGYVEPWR